jgi:hypothetical protein
LYYDNGWELFTSANQEPNCEVKIQDNYAWKIFTKGIKREEAIENSEIIGNKNLGQKIFDMIAVMA